MKNSLSERMKNYESVSKYKLMTRVPVIIRLDGKAFHTFTKDFIKPFDEVLLRSMQNTTLDLCKNIQGCKLGYVQSDEISLLLVDYDNFDTSAFFDYELSKIESITASMATLYFNVNFQKEVDIYIKNNPGEEAQINIYKNKIMSALFDSRARNYPKEEVTNYFVWRQQDASRNSVQMVAQSIFSQAEHSNKNIPQLQDLLRTKGVSWHDYPTATKLGTCVFKEEPSDSLKKRGSWVIDTEIPAFTLNRDYTERFVYI